MNTIAIILSTQVLLAVPQDAQKSPYKPYHEVITAEAKSQEGMFKVHQVGEKIYFEIPENMLGKDMLWQAQETAIPAQLGGVGFQNHRIVRWGRRAGKIFLMGPDYSLRSRDVSGIDLAVRLASPPAIIAAFKVEAEGKDGTAVVDVSDFLVSDPPDLGIGQSWNGQLDRNRSYVDKVKAFSENIEMRSMLTFRINPVSTFDESPSNSAFAFPMGPNASILMHYSFLKLPDEPMMPRYRDGRVGYFGLQVREIGGPENRSVLREIIKRFRLEKKDPNAALSEPVKPITIYVTHEVPAKWRPYAMKAIEAWQPAFEQAGFKNAIQAKMAPTPQEDPDWDPEDARYSVIRWQPSAVENAFGLTMADPRSGEIMCAQVVFYHSFLGWLQDTYFAQVAALDPRTHKLPFDDKLTGELIQYILTHEVGHAIGLEHNFKSSLPYTIENLRNPAFVEKHDIAASIMDYARFNYVAQPGDGVPLKRGIGAYDKFAIEWGYTPISSAKTSDEERPHLDRIADRQTTDPYVRFGNYLYPVDPGTIGEDISNDPIEAAKLGILNVRRAANLLVKATNGADKENKQLSLTYKHIVWQHQQYFDNAIRLVGGVYTDDHLLSQGKEIFRPVPRDKQRSAVKFICGPATFPPAELTNLGISRRLFASGDIRRLVSFPNIIIFSLFTESRIIRMFDQEASYGAKAYPVREMLEDIQAAVWPQLLESKPVIDSKYRQYQLGYLQTIDGKLNGTAATKTDLLGLAHASLKKLALKIDKALPKVTDERTATHLVECRRQIEAIRKGTSPASKIVPPPAAPPRITGGRVEGCCSHPISTNGFGLSKPLGWE